jgi:hypothetical protein
MIGDVKAIEKAISDLKSKGFALKLEGTLEDYLSCEILIDMKTKRGWIQQPHLLAKLEKKFGDEVKQKQTYKTPGTPGGGILRNTGLKVDEEKHKKYRSGVGMLLYLVKHTRPDIANAVRELTKGLDEPSPAAYKEMLRVIKFVLDTKAWALKVAPVLEEGEVIWNMVVYSDSDYAGDKETRVSVTGFVVYLLGVPISWKSKGQKPDVAQSSTEAEHIALSMAAKEIKFICQIINGIGIKVKTPVVVKVDNIGAVFLSDNIAVNDRTKHIDVKYRFVQQCVVDGFVKVIFVKTVDNDADIFTKNLGGDLHQKHASKMIVKKET